MQRIVRQAQTLRAMVVLYCKDIHGSKAEPCSQCHELLAYAQTRLQNCRYLPDKPVCSKCPASCYKPEQRRQIVEVMRYAGPRMLFRHPALALLHLKDKLAR